MDGDGSWNVATIFPWLRTSWRRRSRRFLVVNDSPNPVGGHRGGPYAGPCERNDNVQRRRGFLLPCRAVSVQRQAQYRDLEIAVHGRQAIRAGCGSLGELESRRLPRWQSRAL